jgi:hypothetical protein
MKYLKWAMPLAVAGAISVGSASADMTLTASWSASLDNTPTAVIHSSALSSSAGVEVYLTPFLITPSGQSSFYSFCADITREMTSLPQAYSIQIINNNLGLQRAQWLYDTYYSPVFGSGRYDPFRAAALQLAVWETIYDTSAIAGYSLSSGSFWVSLNTGRAQNTDADQSLILGYANGYLTGVGASEAARLYQNQSQPVLGPNVTSPVPGQDVPELASTCGLLALGLTSLGALRRSARA